MRGVFDRLCLHADSIRRVVWCTSLVRRLGGLFVFLYNDGYYSNFNNYGKLTALICFCSVLERFSGSRGIVCLCVCVCFTGYRLSHNPWTLLPFHCETHSRLPHVRGSSLLNRRWSLKYRSALALSTCHLQSSNLFFSFIYMFFKNYFSRAFECLWQGYKSFV